MVFDAKGFKGVEPQLICGLGAFKKPRIVTHKFPEQPE